MMPLDEQISVWSADWKLPITVDPSLKNRKISAWINKVPRRRLLELIASTFDAEWQSMGSRWVLRQPERIVRLERDAWKSYREEFDTQLTEWLQTAPDDEWPELAHIPGNRLQKLDILRQSQPTWLSIPPRPEAPNARRWLHIDSADSPAAIRLSVWSQNGTVTKLDSTQQWNAVGLAFDMAYDQQIQKWIIPLRGTTRSRKPTFTEDAKPSQPRASSTIFLESAAKRYGINLILDATRATFPNPYATLRGSDLGTELDLVMQTCGCSVRDEEDVILVRPRVGWYLHATDPDEAAVRGLGNAENPSLEEFASYATGLDPIQAFRHASDQVELPFEATSLGKARSALTLWLTLTSEQRQRAFNASPILYQELGDRAKSAFRNCFTASALNTAESFRDPQFLPMIADGNFEKLELFLEQLVEPIARYRDAGSDTNITVPIDGIPNDPKLKVEYGTRRTFTFNLGQGAGSAIQISFALTTWKR